MPMIIEQHQAWKYKQRGQSQASTAKAFYKGEMWMLRREPRQVWRNEIN